MKATSEPSPATCMTGDGATPKTGVIISTYNNPVWLEKTLWSYLHQTHPADEIIIADDGSGPETRSLINSFSDKLPITHVWHEDRGFEKSRILNSALLASSADYLIFTDQDCVARPDFIATHLRYARKGRFLSGGYLRLPMDISVALTCDDISSQRAFSLRWLKARGLKAGIKGIKLTTRRWLSILMNHITPAKATWNGCNASGWREDLLAVNGFNEDMHYGGQDREFGQRLINMGIRPKQIRYSAVALHLDHKRPYKTPETMAKNRAIRAATKKQRIIATPAGISQRH